MNYLPNYKHHFLNRLQNYIDGKDFSGTGFLKYFLSLIVSILIAAGNAIGKYLLEINGEEINFKDNGDYISIPNEEIDSAYILKHFENDFNLNELKLFPCNLSKISLINKLYIKQSLSYN